jgi:peptide/nickel transport system permease protein
MTNIPSSSLYDAKPSKPAKDEKDQKKGEEFYRAGQWQLVWWKFRRHRLAQWALVVLAILYFIAAFAEFMSPLDPRKRYKSNTEQPPASIHIRDVDGNFHWPFIYDVIRTRDKLTMRPKYEEDTSVMYPIKLFVHGDPYLFWGFNKGDLHLFGTGVEEVPLFVLGSDQLGRDMLSRNFFGGRISLTIGLLGIALSFFFGLALGGIAGYFGGMIDEIIMRVIDILVSLPTIPLWMALAAALPADWPQLKSYFYVTIILAILAWTTLARTVRGKMLSTREEDYILSAKLDGETQRSIIARYMLPGFASYIIVSLTISIPGMILGETSLSFLGIGLKSPTISWGVMLNEAQNLSVISQLPWLLWPVAFVVVSVLMFNFLGDGLRDAADPYGT